MNRSVPVLRRQADWPTRCGWPRAIFREKVPCSPASFGPSPATSMVTPSACKTRPSSNSPKPRQIIRAGNRPSYLASRLWPASSPSERSGTRNLSRLRRYSQPTKNPQGNTAMADYSQPSLPDAFSRVVSDLADLMQKEMRLAKAEIANKLSIGIRAGIWISVSAILAVVVLLLVVQACVLGLSAATGLALHWSSLIVAAVLGVIAIASFLKGKTNTPELAPDRAIRNVKQDIAAAKEQFS